MKECSNCGNKFFPGEGFPENEWECCCDFECWMELVNE